MSDATTWNGLTRKANIERLIAARPRHDLDSVKALWATRSPYPPFTPRPLMLGVVEAGGGGRRVERHPLSVDSRLRHGDPAHSQCQARKQGLAARPAAVSPS